MTSSKTILYFVLNWGLGHATRSIPIIRALINRGNRVILVSTGRALHVLQSEFPENECLDVPDYNIRYSRTAWALIPFLLLQTPKIFRALSREHAITETLVKTYRADLIVSDNRYGCYSKTIPSFFITHQLRFQVPKGLGWSACISEWFNRLYFRHYTQILIPDEKGTPNLSGDLSHKGAITRHPKLCYIGGFSSLFSCEARETDIDLLVIISGPEPQRTRFEGTILSQIRGVAGKKVIVLGRPESTTESDLPGDETLEIHTHLDRRTMAQYIHRAKRILTRSGYSTVMELAALNKAAIFVPTPGQTEQEYLARYHQSSNHWIFKPQSDLNINAIMTELDHFQTSETQWTLNRVDEICELLFNSFNEKAIQ